MLLNGFWQVQLIPNYIVGTDHHQQFKGLGDQVPLASLHFVIRATHQSVIHWSSPPSSSSWQGWWLGQSSPFSQVLRAASTSYCCQLSTLLVYYTVHIFTIHSAHNKVCGTSYKCQVSSEHTSHCSASTLMRQTKMHYTLFILHTAQSRAQTPLCSAQYTFDALHTTHILHTAEPLAT